jgi:hypothetical protein
MTITADDQTFAIHLSMLSGLDQRVVTAWTVAETSGGTSGVRGYNFLNVGNTDSNPYGGPRWSSPEQAAQGTYTWLLQNPASGRNILAAAGQPPASQLNAIAASPFASSHYTDRSGKVGGNLVSAYNGLTLGGQIGGLLQPVTAGVQGAISTGGGGTIGNAIGGAQAIPAAVSKIKDVGSLLNFLGGTTFRYGLAFVALTVIALVIFFRKPIAKGAALAAVA